MQGIEPWSGSRLLAASTRVSGLGSPATFPWSSARQSFIRPERQGWMARLVWVDGSRATRVPGPSAERQAAWGSATKVPLSLASTLARLFRAGRVPLARCSECLPSVETDHPQARAMLTRWGPQLQPPRARESGLRSHSPLRAARETVQVQVLGAVHLDERPVVLRREGRPFARALHAAARPALGAAREHGGNDAHGSVGVEPLVPSSTIVRGAGPLRARRRATLRLNPISARAPRTSPRRSPGTGSRGAARRASPRRPGARARPRAAANRSRG